MSSENCCVVCGILIRERTFEQRLIEEEEFCNNCWQKLIIDFEE